MTNPSQPPKQYKTWADVEPALRPGLQKLIDEARITRARQAAEADQASQTNQTA